MCGIFTLLGRPATEDLLPAAMLKAYMVPTCNNYHANLFVVVNFSVVHEIYIGVLESSHWLHSIQIIHDSQSVKGKARAWKMIDIFYSESVWSPVCDLVRCVALERDVPVTPEYSPYTAHGSR